MRRLLAAAVLLWSCATMHGAGGPGPCHTPCGMTTIEADCETLQRYEGQILRRLELGVTDYHERRMCRAINGWTVRLHRHDALPDKLCAADSWVLFIDLWTGRPFCAGGYTHPDTKVIELGTTADAGGFEWQPSALAHEITHVVDIDVTGRVGHCRWADPGLKMAIADLTGESDNTPPEASCDAGTADAGRL